MHEPIHKTENDADDARIFRALLAHCERVKVKVDPQDKQKVIGLMLEVNQQTKTLSFVQHEMRSVIEKFISGLDSKK